MLSPTDVDQLKARLLVMQIITGALMMGVVSFMAVTFVIPAGNPRNELTWIMLGATVPLVVAYVVVPDLIAARQVRHLAAGDLLFQALIGAFQTRLIVALALLEGAAFLALLAYLLEHQLVALAAAVFFLLAMALSFPTRDRLERWLEAQQRSLAGGQSRNSS